MKTTYYTKEGNTLKKVGSVILTAKGYVSNPTEADYAAMVDANGKPNPAYPRSEESFAPPKCDEGYHAIPDGYELKDGKWVKLWKVEELPPPPPRVFSKFKVVRLLTEMGIWLKVRDYIVAKGLYDLFLAAQDFKEDDEFFIKGLTELKAKFGMSDEEVGAILKEGVA
jgi:hypothetical protein